MNGYEEKREEVHLAYIKKRQREIEGKRENKIGEEREKAQTALVKVKPALTFTERF